MNAAQKIFLMTLLGLVCVVAFAAAQDGASADSVAPASESADVSADADADAAIDEPESPMDEVAKEGASADEGSESGALGLLSASSTIFLGLIATLVV